VAARPEPPEPSLQEVFKKLRKVVVKNKVPPDDCVICLAPYEIGVTLRRYQCPGKHFYHEECIWAWVKRDVRCPTCRWDPILEDYR